VLQVWFGFAFYRSIFVFPSFILLSISEKSSKIKFLEKFKKIPFKFYVKMGQRGTWETLGGPTMPPHHMVARPGLGRAVAW
jgi:hypothetical protein